MSNSKFHHTFTTPSGLDVKIYTPTADTSALDKINYKLFFEGN